MCMRVEGGYARPCGDVCACMSVGGGVSICGMYACAKTHAKALCFVPEQSQQTLTFFF